MTSSIENTLEKKQSEDDFAQVEINTPFDKDWLLDFIHDPHRVLRINSLFEFTAFELVNDKADTSSWRMAGKYLSNDQPFDVTFTTQATASGILLSYKGWLKNSTELLLKKGDDDNYSLLITDDYSGTSVEQREQRITEVDNTIVPWANDIYRYLQQWKRWSWLPGFQFYMLKFWPKMKPSARRISFMLMAITAAEFVLFLFVFVIFYLELPGMLLS